MKAIFSIVTIIFISQISNFQEITGKYEIQEKGHFSTIELIKDKSFKYEYRGPSCWVWHDKIGKWKTEGNTLILKDSFEWRERAVIMEESEDQILEDQIIIQFITNDKEPIKNFEVEYGDIFESKFLQKGITDSQGIVRFIPIKAKYYPEKDRARLSFTYSEYNDEISNEVFPKLMNNKITIEINSTPKIEMQERIDKYKIVENELIGMEGNSLDSGMKFKKK